MKKTRCGRADAMALDAILFWRSTLVATTLPINIGPNEPHFQTLFHRLSLTVVVRISVRAISHMFIRSVYDYSYRLKVQFLYNLRDFVSTLFLNYKHVGYIICMHARQWRN